MNFTRNIAEENPSNNSLNKTVDFSALSFYRKTPRETHPNRIHHRSTIRIGDQFPKELVSEQRAARRIDGQVAVELAAAENLVPKSTHEGETHQRCPLPLHTRAFGTRAERQLVLVGWVDLAAKEVRQTAKPVTALGRPDPQHIAGLHKLQQQRTRSVSVRTTHCRRMMGFSGPILHSRINLLKRSPFLVHNLKPTKRESR